MSAGPLAQSPPDGAPYRAYLYRGNSMGGTFRQGDLLLVAPVALEAVHPGDVVAFRRARADGGELLVAHRVQERRATTLTTRGDSSAPANVEIVPGENLVGRVCLVQRNGFIYSVQGGRVGQVRAAYLRLRRILLQLVHRPYQVLKDSGVVRHLWRPDLAQVQVNTAAGPVVKYVHGQRTVASWWPVGQRFWCRKPYDLVIQQPNLVPTRLSKKVSLNESIES